MNVLEGVSIQWKLLISDNEYYASNGRKNCVQNANEILCFEEIMLKKQQPLNQKYLKIKN